MSHKWTTGSLTRALVHHGATFVPPDPYRPPGAETKWVVTTGIGDITMTGREVHAYCVGLADMKHRLYTQAKFPK